MNDEQRATGLQSIFHAGQREALAPLRDCCQQIAASIVRWERKRRGIHLSVQAIEEIASDAAGQLIAHYLRNPGYSVQRFRVRLAYEVRNILNEPLRSHQRSFESQMHLTPDADRHESAAAARPAIHPEKALEVLVADHEHGKKIAADLARSTSYRVAVKRIACYVERSWIYEHAEALHQVFRTFHWRPSSRGGQGQPAAGAGGLRETLRRGKQDERVESHRGADKVAEG